MHQACCWNAEICWRHGILEGDQLVDAREVLQQRQGLRSFLQRHRRAALGKQRNESAELEEVAEALLALDQHVLAVDVFLAEPQRRAARLNTRRVAHAPTRLVELK